jgi:aspartate carbamoyltransferase catalytic subunit
MRHDHLITAAQLSRDDIEAVLDRAAAFEADPASLAERHAGSILGLCFFEPSTRTKMSLR